MLLSYCTIHCYLDIMYATPDRAFSCLKEDRKAPKQRKLRNKFSSLKEEMGMPPLGTHQS